MSSEWHSKIKSGGRLCEHVLATLLTFSIFNALRIEMCSNVLHGFRSGHVGTWVTSYQYKVHHFRDLRQCNVQAKSSSSVPSYCLLCYDIRINQCYCPILLSIYLVARCWPPVNLEHLLFLVLRCLWIHYFLCSHSHTLGCSKKCDLMRHHIERGFAR